MLEIKIPGQKVLRLEHLVLDYNGTIAFDGQLIAGVDKCLTGLSESVGIHVITADTFGGVREGLGQIACTLHLIREQDQDRQKLEYVKKLGVHRTVCIGNGRNDRLMLEEAALGIGIVSAEGAFPGTLLHSDVVCTSIIGALELLIYPKRLQATLRN